MTDDLLASDPTPVEEFTKRFFGRPGDMYLIEVRIPAAAAAFQFAVKADPSQLPYAREILHQLRGAIGQSGAVTMTKAQILDPLPGNARAYAVRPPTPWPAHEEQTPAPTKQTPSPISDASQLLREDPSARIQPFKPEAAITSVAEMEWPGTEDDDYTLKNVEG